MKKFLSLFISVLMLVLSVPFNIGAKTDKVIPFRSPAICTDTGKEISLSHYDVEFEPEKVTDAGHIKWSGTGISVKDGKVKAEKEGVYRLTAKNQNGEKSIYLVAKKPSDKEYVLYYDDFSSDTLSSYREIYKSAGAKTEIRDGNLILDASKNTVSGIRLLLPDWLGDFGNYSVTSSVSLDKTVNNLRWLSLMYRVQNNDYPYWHTCVRKDASVYNGLEIAQRNEDNKWFVPTAKAYTENIKDSVFYTLSTSVVGNAAITNVNGKNFLYYNNIQYQTGDIGVQVNAGRAMFDYIKVTVADTLPSPNPGNLTAVRSPQSNIILPPVMVTEIDSEQTLGTILDNSPAVAIMYTDSNLSITDSAGNVITDIDSALKQLDRKVIPAFYLKDKAAVSPLKAYLSKHKLTDVYVMSDSTDILTEARKNIRLCFGILDCGSRTVTDKDSLYAIRNDTNAASAKVAIIPESAASRSNVEFLQRLLITVWVKPEEKSKNDTDYIGAITSGANGIVTSDRARLENMFTEYFPANTMIRSPGVVGHRGVPSLEQENTIKGALRAYELGATMVENDIYVTKDNVIVVMHDPTLDRTTDGKGKVQDYTYEELKKFSVDSNASVPPEPIPTLEDYFKAIKGKDIQLYIEIKSNAAPKVEELMYKLIEKYDIADQVNSLSFSEFHISSMRKTLPGISMGYVTSSYSPNEYDPLNALEQVMPMLQTSNTSFHPSYAKGNLGPNFYREASYRGITVCPWTFADEKVFNNYFMYGTAAMTCNYSQYVTDYAKEITLDSHDINITEKETEVPVNMITYGRSKTRAENASMVVVDNDGLSLEYSNGILRAEGKGKATVFFRLDCKTSSDQTHFLCTEPLTVTCTAITDGNVSETETAPVTEGQNSTDKDPESEQNRNYVPLIVTVCVTAAVIAVAVVISVIKKKK